MPHEHWDLPREGEVLGEEEEKRGRGAVALASDDGKLFRAPHRSASFSYFSEDLRI
jgi:hypothetical protein